MKTFLFAIILGLGLVVAPRAVALDQQDGFVCWVDDPSCDTLGGGGGACAPTDKCCICKAACKTKNTADRKSCDDLSGAARLTCYAEADYKKKMCNQDCTINDKCQDA